MNLRWITLFATIAEEGSFTRAATKLNIAQPWLSAQLRKLEYELGVQLLIRENVGVKVTEAGERLLPHARQMAESARLFRETARSLSDTHSRVVKLGCHIPIIDMPVLKAISMNFAERYSNFELNTITQGPVELVKALDECRIDLALLPGEPIEAGPELEYCVLGSAQVYLLMPKKRKVNAIAALKGETVGIPPREWGADLHQRLGKVLEEAGLVPVEVPEYDRRAIEHGVTARSELAALALDENDLASLDPGIHALRLEGLSTEHRLCRVSGRELSRAAERFWIMCNRSAEADAAAVEEAAHP